MNITDFIEFVQSEAMYNSKDFIPLHAPVFKGNEKKYLNDCIDSTFVSSVGEYVDRFEKICAEYTGAKYTVAVVNGTAALHTSLILSGVEAGDEVITQALTFVATANAISYTGAEPIFLDVDKHTLGLSANSLLKFLETKCEVIDGECINKQTQKRVKACVPMHTFGFPCEIQKIVQIAEKYHIAVIEDSAESLGSFVGGQHTGTFGQFGVLSFNGNKTLTCGGGGMILTNNESLAKKAKHITTTAKLSHKWDYNHDMMAYNYRLTNLSAALGLAQMEQINSVLKSKRKTHDYYREYFSNENVTLVEAQENTTVNYWLNTIIFNHEAEKNEFLEQTNKQGVMSRPIWVLMNKLPMYKNCYCDDLTNSKWFEKHTVNIPSSAG